MDTIHWKVEGMSCTNCALTIHKYLEEKGFTDVKVNFIGGDVSFNSTGNITNQDAEKGITKLGYHVVHNEEDTKSKKLFANHLQRFLFCLAFTLPLLLHMVGVHIEWLMNGYVQLALTLPVFIAGMSFFGRSAINSLFKGIPNMNVLIALGAVASFVYSLYGTITNNPLLFMFYETTATIITLIFFGNYIEERSVAATQSALKKLAVTQKVMANMITYTDGEEYIFQVESNHLHVGDFVLIKTGEYVPADCKILSGEASVNESILTGESVPVEKGVNDKLIGGSILESGTIRAYVTAVGDNTVLNNILKLVKEAQTEKPPIQQLADKISTVFVPVVVSIALVTFLINFFAAGQGFSTSLLRSIAVLVIACPCAMGLATPAAIAVGLGRAARNGILFKNAKSLEIFKNIKQVVFDKTGTLTTGEFKIAGFKVEEGAALSNEDFKTLVYSLERFSNHPIARGIIKEWKVKNAFAWVKTEEIKGMGIKAIDKEGNIYLAGSFKMAERLTDDYHHNVYITKNGVLTGWVDVRDDVRPEAKQVIGLLHAAGIKTILLSGDKKEKCEAVAVQLGIGTVIAEQTPQQKLDTIAELDKKQPTAMVGDGINDAPALAKATIGISLSDATHIAMQSAQVILMGNGLKYLPLSLGLGKATFTTIKQNLFWAFAYNVIAIPVAALGFLSPAFSALAMGFSDVVLAINSIRLNCRKVSG